MDKIGDFAKRCQTTIKTLRYYDELGLLVPDYIDAFTNYRYYGTSKVAEMCKITELKAVGFTLEEIKRYCNGDADEQTLIIEEKHRALVKLADDIAQQLDKLAKIKSASKRGEIKMNINTPFENDERIIGRWEFVNETNFSELYFLPDGEEYWGFSWTKGYIKITFDGGLIVPYQLKKVDGETLMFVDFPSNERGWKLRQMDNKVYTKSEIGQWDDIDLPFVDHPAVHGQWVSVDFVREIDEFNPSTPQASYLWLKSVEFMVGGQLLERFGDETTFAIEQQKTLLTSNWTKGKLLVTRNEGTVAPAYVIREINGTDYMFLEWKSGDFIWGKWKPQYYVLTKID